MKYLYGMSADTFPVLFQDSTGNKEAAAQVTMTKKTSPKLKKVHFEY